MPGISTALEDLVIALEYTFVDWKPLCEERLAEIDPLVSALAEVDDGAGESRAFGFDFDLLAAAPRSEAVSRHVVSAMQSLNTAEHCTRASTVLTTHQTQMKS